MDFLTETATEKRKEEKPKKNGVIVAIDVDNLLISSFEKGPEIEGYSLKAGFEKMFAWIETFGKILCVHLYLPRSQFTTNDSLFHSLWEEYKERFILEIIYCPKRKVEDLRKKVDNVDSHLICHTQKMVDIFGDQTGYFCLVSGDIDYSPLLWELRRERNIEIAFAFGSEKSFSKVYRQMKIVAKHPITGEELTYCFSPHKEQ